MHVYMYAMKSNIILLYAASALKRMLIKYYEWQYTVYHHNSGHTSNGSISSPTFSASFLAEPCHLPRFSGQCRCEPLGLRTCSPCLEEFPWLDTSIRREGVTSASGNVSHLHQMNPKAHDNAGSVNKSCQSKYNCQILMFLSVKF